MAKDATRQQQGGFDGRTTVAVIGVGSFAQGLVSLALRSGADARYAFKFGSRRMQQGCSYQLPGLEKAPVCNIDDALADADIVILALPAGSIVSLISQYGEKLAHKVVVDVMNPWGKDLRKLTSDSCASMLPVDTESPKNNITAAGGADSAGAAYGADLPDCGRTTAKDVDLVTDIADSTNDRKSLTATPSSTAAWLAAALPASAKVVKAFCNLSAYSLLHGDPLTEHMKSVAASDDSEAAETVAELGRAMGIEVRTVGDLSYASVLEARQCSLMKDWQWPFLLMVSTWLVVHIYSFIRYNFYGGTPWQHATMWILNKSVGWVALWGLVYTYLPGVLVCYMQLLTRKPSLRLPHWMKMWMDRRKQLGLLSLAAMLLHLLLSTFLWMPSYYAKLWDNTDAAIVPVYNNTTAVDLFGMPKGVKGTAAASTGHVTPSSIKSNISSDAYNMVRVNNVITIRSQLNWVGESSTLLGIVSGCLMGLIALTSMPSVTPKLNWREWRLLQSQAGWLAVITATVRTVGDLSYASVLEARQCSLMKDWQWPFLLMVSTWLVVHIYSFIRYNFYGGTPWQHATMWILNKSVGWVALWGLVYTYLPGVLVCYMQLLTRKPSLRLPHWMKMWMDRRKQLGLLSLAAMLLHLLLSTFLWMPSYYAKLWDNTDAAIVPVYNNTTAVDLFGMPKGVKGTAAASTGHVTPSSIKSNISSDAYNMVRVNNVITIRSQLNWVGESSTLLGIVSGCLMGLIALTSMPSVTPKLNWREWRLLQSQAGWLAVITATVHVLLLGAPWWPRYRTDWPAMIPTITLMSTIPPMMLLALKGLISLPPLSCVLARVRSGRLARRLTNAEAVNSTPVYAVAHM